MLLPYFAQLENAVMQPTSSWRCSEEKYDHKQVVAQKFSEESYSRLHMIIIVTNIKNNDVQL